MNRPDLSIVVPVKNEEVSIEKFLQVVVPSCVELSINYEIIFVNDGSIDQTLQVLREACTQYSHIKVVNLSRNFGKELALTAGLNHSKGNAVIPMDVDLQDPPSLIKTLYEKFCEGFDVVIPIRQQRAGDTRQKRLFAKLFYRAFKTVSDIDIYENAGDFRIMSRRVVDVVETMPERTRFMKGILSWPGFSTSLVYYDRPERAKGQTKWRFTSLWNLALDGIFSFSTLPLKVWTYIGFTLSLVSILYMVFTILKTAIYGIDLPGYASLLSITLLIGGVNLMGIGVLGEYVSRIFIEVKARPLYVVEEVFQSPSTKEHTTAD